MNQRNQIKTIVASLCTVMSIQALAGLGGLQVQSSLGEPFAGSIVATGEEARLLLNNNGAVVISGAPLRATVVRQGDNAVIRLRSTQAIQEPLLSFGLAVGGQGRQYNAIMDPPNYRVQGTTPRADTGTDASRTAAQAAVSAALAQEPEKRNTGVQRNAAASVFAGQRYTVQPQENLIDVARKVQPQGLTLAQTMRALVNANPRAFRNGNPDLMYKNVTLKIPTAEQMRTLARQPVSKPTPPVAVAPKAEQKGTPSPSVPIIAAPTVASEPATEPQPIPQMASAASVPMAASSVMSSEPMMASEVVPVAAPQPEVAPASVVVSQTESPTGFLAGLWPYLLGATGVLLLALLLLLRRRQQAKANDDEVFADDDEEEIESIELTDKPYAIALADEGVDDANDVVFTHVEQTIEVTKTPNAEHVGGHDKVVAEVKAKSATTEQIDAVTQDGWGQLAQKEHVKTVMPTSLSEAPTTHALEEGDDWLDAPELTPLELQTHTLAETNIPAEKADVAAKPVDDDWLQFDVADLSDATKETAKETASVEDWSWVEEAEVTDNTVPTVTLDNLETEQEDMAWLTESIEAKPEPQVKPASKFIVTATAATATAMADTPPMPVTDELDALAWDDAPMSAHTVSDAQPSAEAELNKLADIDDLAWDDGLDLSQQEAIAVQKNAEPSADAQQRHAFAVSEQDLAVAEIDWAALGLSDDVPEVAIEPNNQHEPANTDIAQALDEFDTVSTQAVPMTENLLVPLEAKLELAQMYLEIDDAQTARKTLQELVTEADGDILAKAQSLLAQLGD